MASYSKESFRVEKLNSKNYAVWKFELQMFHMKEDLFNHLTDGTPNPITNDWTKKDNRARAIINLTLEDSK